MSGAGHGPASHEMALPGACCLRASLVRQLAETEAGVVHVGQRISLRRPQRALHPRRRCPGEVLAEANKSLKFPEEVADCTELQAGRVSAAHGGAGSRERARVDAREGGSSAAPAQRFAHCMLGMREHLCSGRAARVMR